MAFSAHPTAVIDPGAVIGEGSKVWHFAHVCGGAQVGRSCVFGQNTYVSGTCTVGDFCKVQNNVSLYDGVHLGEGVFVGPSAVFTNDLMPRARPFGGHWAVTDTRVERGASIGANATVVCGTTLGESCMVGAGSTVTRSVKPFALVAGVPARQIGWVSAAGFKLNAPLTSDVRIEVACATSGEKYVLEGSSLSRA